MWFLLREGGLGHDCDGLQRIAILAPGIEPALEGANVFNSAFSEEERHTGARSFVWSSAVEDDFAVGRQPVVFFL
jgi:hypothetical protein